MKEGFLNSFRESHTVKQRQFNIQNIIDQREVMGIVKCCKEIIKTIKQDAIQGQMLKLKIWKDYF